MSSSPESSLLRPSRVRSLFGWGGLAVGIAVLFLLDLAWGSARIPLGDVLDVLTGGAAARAAWTDIVLQLRLPRALTAVLVGAALSVSGLQMQTLFRNPLAGPFVLGLNAGASLGVALVVLAASASGFAWLSTVGGAGAWTLVVAATIGAGLVMAGVALVGVRVEDSATLLIIGLMFSSATAAVVGILQYFSRAEQIQAYLIWTFGSLGGVTWTQMRVFAPVVLVGLALGLLLVKPLNALLLGERYARSMGVRTRAVRLSVIASTSLLAGSVTAFCGPIAFLGLAVPHLTRALFDSSDHRRLVPGVMGVGAALTLVCDIVSRLPGSALSLPINAVTSLIGAPVVVWVILRRRSLGGAFTA